MHAASLGEPLCPKIEEEPAREQSAVVVDVEAEGVEESSPWKMVELEAAEGEVAAPENPQARSRPLGPSSAGRKLRSDPMRMPRLRRRALRTRRACRWRAWRRNRLGHLSQRFWFTFSDGIDH